MRTYAINISSETPSKASITSSWDSNTTFYFVDGKEVSKSVWEDYNVSEILDFNDEIPDDWDDYNYIDG